MSGFIRATQAPATPQQRQAALSNHLANRSHLDTFAFVMGLKNLPNLPPICQELARWTIMVCLDLEHWTDNTDHTTEVGMVLTSSSKSQAIIASGHLGDHGQNMLQESRYYFYRLEENSHMVSNISRKGGSSFGQERYVAIQDMQTILRGVFNQRITGVAGLENCNRPIILLGHAVSHDVKNLREKTVAFDIDAQGTVVKTIDTQQMARDAAIWTHPTNNIGLRKLIKDLDFEHGDDAHSAGNDASRTHICAVQILLNYAKAPPRNLAMAKRAKDNASKSMQEIEKEVAEHSREEDNYHSLGGRPDYCRICGATTHMADDCRVSNQQQCTYCETMANRARNTNDQTAYNRCRINTTMHTTKHCPFKAGQDAIDRRARHAAIAAARGRGRGGGRCGYPRGGRGGASGRDRGGVTTTAFGSEGSLASSDYSDDGYTSVAPTYA
jgi:hypothetical protein